MLHSLCELASRLMGVALAGTDTSCTPAGSHVILASCKTAAWELAPLMCMLSNDCGP